MVFLTTFIALGCTFFNLEINPFAPYSMYSYPYFNSYYSELEIYFVLTNGRRVEANNKMLFPWDEARLKEYLSKREQEGKLENINYTLEEVLKLASSKFVAIVVEKREWQNLTIKSFCNPTVILIAEVRR